MPGNAANKVDVYIENDLNYVNGIPWPRISPDVFNKEHLREYYNKDTDTYHVPLKKYYLHQAMNYLDSEQANPLFKWQADFIIKNNCKKILDVGCRHAPILDYLYDANYMDSEFYYYGFDTSEESISIGNQKWNNFSNVVLEENDWEKFKKHPMLDDSIDCVVFSGVLLYAPDGHEALFDQFTNQLYKSKYAIIQEPCKQQTHWLDQLYLNTIQDQLHMYKEQYTVVDNTITDLEIFSGRRELLGLKLSNT